MTQRIVFHIGFEKTGTSSFQRFCVDNHDALLAGGILYPVHSLICVENRHSPLVSCYLPYNDFNMGPGRAGRSQMLQVLREEIGETSPDIVLISSEHFSSRFRETEIRRLAADFAGYDCRIVAVVKDHQSLLRSAYSQTVMSGRALTFDDYCDEVFDRGNRYLRYKETIEAWENAFGRANVNVHAYRPGADIVPRLCAALIPQAERLPAMPHYWENRSPGAGAIELLRRANAVFYNRTHKKVAGDYSKWQMLRYAHTGLRTLIAITAGNWRQDALRLSERALRRLKDITDVDNPWLQSRYGIRLSEPKGEARRAGIGIRKAPAKLP